MLSFYFVVCCKYRFGTVVLIYYISPKCLNNLVFKSLHCRSNALFSSSFNVSSIGLECVRVDQQHLKPLMFSFTFNVSSKDLGYGQVACCDLLEETISSTFIVSFERPDVWLRSNLRSSKENNLIYIQYFHQEDSCLVGQ